jgi:hypothetical protein
VRHFYLIKAREEDEEEEGKEEDEEEEGKEEDARMGGRSNTNNSEEDEEADEVTNYTSTTNPIFDQAVENAKKTETEMEIWIANATNASVTFIDEVVSAIEDVATSGHFNVSSPSNSEETNEDSTTAVVPVVQELQNDHLEVSEEEKKFEILRNVPEFRYRSSGALGGASTSDFSSKSSIPSASKSAMLLQNVNEYDRKDFFVFGTLSMAFCVAFFVAVVLRKHAQKFKVVAAGEETTSEEEKEEEEEAALMRNERGAIKYGSVV